MEINISPLNIKRNFPVSDEVTAENTAELARYRKELGEKITAQKLLDNNTPIEYTATFDGYGDSGQYNNDSGSAEVDALFSYMVDTVVTFDWYNNDGGGGDITWNVITDVITINGYVNVTTQEDAMCEETF